MPCTTDRCTYVYLDVSVHVAENLDALPEAVVAPDHTHEPLAEEEAGTTEGPEQPPSPVVRVGVIPSAVRRLRAGETKRNNAENEDRNL